MFDKLHDTLQHSYCNASGPCVPKGHVIVQRPNPPDISDCLPPPHPSRERNAAAHPSRERNAASSTHLEKGCGLLVCARARVCVCARAHACARACVCVPGCRVGIFDTICYASTRTVDGLRRAERFVLAGCTASDRFVLAGCTASDDRSSFELKANTAFALVDRCCEGDCCRRV